MAIEELKSASISEINKLNGKKDLLKVVRLLSKISLAKQNTPSDLTQHYEIAKRKHKEIIKKLIGKSL